MSNTPSLTATTITNRQIRALGIEAFERGDMALFDLTVKATCDNAEARKACVDVINAAQLARRDR